jgi:hypothetical protein
LLGRADSEMQRVMSLLRMGTRPLNALPPN